MYSFSLCRTRKKMEQVSFCDVIVVVILRCAAPTGFLVRIAARGSDPDFFVIDSLFYSCLI